MATEDEFECQSTLNRLDKKKKKKKRTEQHEHGKTTK